MKGKPVNNVLSECLEDQLDSGVLGQVGSELFAEVPHSVMFPNSMGIICMETKVSVNYILGHSLSIFFLTVIYFQRDHYSNW